MLFAVSGVECSPFLPFCAGFAISFFCAGAGISGAFLLLPWQVSFLGYTAPGVSGTNQIFNILACPSGVWRYARDGRLLMPLVYALAAGTLPGVFAGAWIRIWLLPNPSAFRIFAALVLIWLGIRLARKGKKPQNDRPQGKLEILENKGFSGFTFRFDGIERHVSFWPLFAMAFIVGITGGIYGVGGGAIISPFLVSFFELPVHAIAGAALFSTFLTSIAGVTVFSLFSTAVPSASPDWALGLLMGAGGLFGMYLGASFQKRLRASLIRKILSFAVIFIGASWLIKALF